ncbi:MAG: FecR family protein [Gammaproteobacteria bacterium]|nr:FecR family protein [Gammaproteobacteria bacterium]MCW9005942.1 FecR family protein [Gammaproteobacteria bacterium]
MINRIYVSLVIVFILSGLAQADNIRGRIVKIQGHVYIVDDKNERIIPAKRKFLINNNETVVTEGNSKAVIQFSDGALSVLHEKSVLRVEKSGWLSQLSGKVYYIFKKVLTRQPKKVYTKFATIGIRGTTFIVDANEGNNMIALQEGGLNIESPDGEYGIRRQNKTESFSDFKDEYKSQVDSINKEYSEYKKQLANEFIEYKKSFDLKENYQVSFNDKEVDEKIITSDVSREFDEFSSFAGGYISAYKELNELN